LTSPTIPQAREAPAEGQALLLAHLEVVERAITFVCRRHHLSSAEADDFASLVKLKLVEDDYSVLRKFQGRSSIRTYLAVVIQRLFLDYRISAWGKWRPSAEAKRAGPVGVLLEQLLVRDGYGFEEACELLKTNHRLPVGRADLEQLAGRLPVRTRRRFESDESLANIPSSDQPADAIVAASDRQSAATRISDVLNSLIARFENQDRLVLMMRFEDGRTVADISATLRLEQKALYRRLDRLLMDLRVGLKAQGIDAPEVLEMLDSRDVSFEWNSHGDRRKIRSSPSIPRGGEECL
jgi:RNA polymerase sigma factor (sigma-70 family)